MKVRLTLWAAAVVVGSAAAAAPALAQPYRHDDWRGHDDWRAHEERREHDRDDYRAGYYRAPPPVVYAAPPRYYAAPPPVVYSPPGVTFGVTIP